jgi:hypothetical protein
VLVNELFEVGLPVAAHKSLLSPNPQRTEVWDAKIYVLTVRKVQGVQRERTGAQTAF